MLQIVALIPTDPLKTEGQERSPMKIKRYGILTTLAAGLALSMLSPPAFAAIYGAPADSKTRISKVCSEPGAVDPARVRSLTLLINAAIARLGPDATRREEVEAIRGVLAMWGGGLCEARAALMAAQSTPGLSGAAALALGSIEGSIGVAMGQTEDGGSQAGTPVISVNGGGSNYRTH